jgi:hypothetical protein
MVVFDGSGQEESHLDPLHKRVREPSLDESRFGEAPSLC